MLMERWGLLQIDTKNNASNNIFSYLYLIKIKLSYALIEYLHEICILGKKLCILYFRKPEKFD